MNTAVNNISATRVPPTCCREGTDAARKGHLACLQSLHKQGSFLRFHDTGRAGAGEARKAEAWLAALAACDGQHPEVLRWLLAGGWPRADAERLPWHFSDVADPSTLMWYTEGRPSLRENIKGYGYAYGTSGSVIFSSPVDVTAINWDQQSEWSEMAGLAGLCDPQTRDFVPYKINGTNYMGDMVCSQWFPQEFQVLWRACRSGDLACHKIIVEAGCRSRWVSVLAALNGQLRFLNFAIKQGCPYEGSTLVAAAAGGHVDCFKRVLKICTKNVQRVSFDVEEGDTLRETMGRPDLFFSDRFTADYPRLSWDQGDWSMEPEERLDLWMAKAAIAAAENSHLDVLTYVMTRNGRAIKKWGFLRGVVNAAVSHGRLSCLQFAEKYGCTPERKAVKLALHTGHAECVPYLMSQGYDMVFRLNSLAAPGGHLGVLEVAAARRKLDCVLLALNVARGRQLDNLRCALEVSEPFSDAETLLDFAAEWGYLSCMHYLHEKGYRAVEKTLGAAVESGSLECVEYAFDIRWQAGEFFPRGCMVVAANCGVALVQFLHQRGCPWEEGTTEAAAMVGCLATLQFCHEHGCPWDPKVIEAAVFADSAACLQYIHTHDCPPLPHPFPAAYNQEVLQYAVEKMGEWGEGVLHATSERLESEYQHGFADWRLLMYMSKKGVALSPVLQRAVDQRIARFKAAVSCFHLATRLADDGGPHAPMWGAMGMVPHVLVEQITRLAHLKL